MGRFARAGFYQVLLALKHRHPALSSAMAPGNLVIRDTGNAKVFAFQRVKGKDRVSVTVNLTGAAQRAKGADGRMATLPAWGWAITPSR
jgi:hypothetical protein